MQSAPNIVLLLADDLGFSDIGCYGGEIETPHIDRLAAQGARFAQFYTTARCSPSRASLLTGLHPHQTGIGVLTKDDRPHGYAGSLNDRCVTLAEVLRQAGYSTCLTGKWHLTSNTRQPDSAWPTRRGFEHFYGTLAGSCSYFQPATLTRGEHNVEVEATLKPDYYYTDAISDEACKFLEARAGSAQPFFLYVAYSAPHWPLQAREEDIEHYRGRFDQGWDVLRQRRLQRLHETGLLDLSTHLSPRETSELTWEKESQKAWQARRMEVYAAQVHRMDQGIGRVVSTIERAGHIDNTIILFLSDNGACAEVLPLDGNAEEFKKRRPDLDRLKPRKGRELNIGNHPGVVPGAEDTYTSYGREWANLSNTPFRYYKRWTHEGGLSTPMIVHWPGGNVKAGTVVREAFQLTDILPTLLEAIGINYPTEYNGRDILPHEGVSFLPVLRGEPAPDHTLYWEHTGNAAIRRGRWKLVREYPLPWELYDMIVDRSELTDLAAKHPELVEDLAQDWKQWATRVGVISWDAILASYRDQGKSESDAAG